MLCFDVCVMINEQLILISTLVQWKSAKPRA